MQSWINEHPLLFVSALLGGMCGFQWLLLNLIANVSGWKILAARFTASQPFSGIQSRWQSARLRFFISYNNCLRIGADQTGLSIQPMWGMRTGHPPLFIPWSEIMVEQAQNWVLPDYVRFSLGRSEQIPFTVRYSLFSKLHTAAGPSWPVSPTLIEN